VSVVEDAATLEHVERPAPNRPVGPWRAGWRRLRRDPWSLSALGAVTLIVLLGLFGGAIVSRLVGHNGTRQFAYAANSNLRPVGPLTRIAAPAQPPIDAYGILHAPPKARPRRSSSSGPTGRSAVTS
jgi:hypothetical protein